VTLIESESIQIGPSLALRASVSMAKEWPAYGLIACGKYGIFL